MCIFTKPIIFITPLILPFHLFNRALFDISHSLFLIFLLIWTGSWVLIRYEQVVTTHLLRKSFTFFLMWLLVENSEGGSNIYISFIRKPLSMRMWMGIGLTLFLLVKKYRFDLFTYMHSLHYQLPEIFPHHKHVFVAVLEELYSVITWMLTLKI